MTSSQWPTAPDALTTAMIPCQASFSLTFHSSALTRSRVCSCAGRAHTRTASVWRSQTWSGSCGLVLRGSTDWSLCLSGGVKNKTREKSLASAVAPLAIRFTNVWGIESPLTNSDAYGYDHTPLSGDELTLNSDVKNIPKQWPTVFSGPVTSRFGLSLSTKASWRNMTLLRNWRTYESYIRLRKHAASILVTCYSAFPFD